MVLRDEDAHLERRAGGVRFHLRFGTAQRIEAPDGAVRRRIRAGDLPGDRMATAWRPHGDRMATAWAWAYRVTLPDASAPVLITQPTAPGSP